MAYRETAKVKKHKADIRAEILCAAEGLVRREGFKILTIQAVAQEANVSAGNIYRYFDGKSGLALEVFRRATVRELSALRIAVERENCCGDAITAGVRVFAERAFLAPALAWTLIAEPVDAELDEARLEYRKAYADIFEKLIEQGVNSGELPRQRASISAAAIVGALAEGLLLPLRQGDSCAGVIDEMIHFCLRAVGGQPNIARLQEARYASE